MNSALVFVQVLALLSATLSVGPVLSAGNDKDTVVLLHVLFRHGNRTPDRSSVFPNDLYINYTYWPFDYSQLTTRGKQTEYNIGRYIRANYGHLIPEQYTPNVVYAISTNIKRTKMSLELVLSALFSPLHNEKIEPTLNWQPLPFNIEQSQGIIGVASAYCASYINQYWQYVISKEAQKIRASYKNLYDELSKYSGLTIQTPRDAGGIYFTLKSEEDLGLKLPEWSEGLYPDIIEEAASVDYEFSTATTGLKKLSAGFLLKKIIQDSFAKRNGSLSDDRKVFLYSAHEYNVGTMLRALNVFYRHVPPFGATIYFEIHNIDGVYGLKLYYQDYKNDSPRLLAIPGCASFCPLDDLYSLVQDVLPGDRDGCSPTAEIA